MGECNMLELKNLSFSVEENGKQKEILHNLNLIIDNSRFVVITGPNGSGKSTLAKLIPRFARSVIESPVMSSPSNKI